MGGGGAVPVWGPGQVWEVTTLPRGHLTCSSPQALGAAQWGFREQQ